MTVTQATAAPAVPDALSSRTFHLTDDEVLQVESVLREAMGRWTSSEDPGFHAGAGVLAQELPRRLRQYLASFKLKEPDAGYCVVDGLQVDDHRIGSTPAHWNQRRATSPTLREEMYLVMLGTLLGDPIAWATQQDGYLVHDIMPIEANRNSQLGTGSEQTLFWHTEDAFHPYRGDYLALLCMRNDDRIGTTVGSLDGVQLDPAHVDVLFQARFTIRPDESHLQRNASDDVRGDETVRQSFQKIEQMNAEPEKIPVFSGDRRSPYLCLDPYFMDELTDDPEAQEALDALSRALDGNLLDVVLEPGQVFIVDNFKAVHGRRAFHARYDGRDRWLKRVNVARDLRKSRGSRRSTEQRAIY